MNKRFVAIWLRHLKTDWLITQKPHLKDVPFVLAVPDHGRTRITEVSAVAKSKGLYAGMIGADAKVVLPEVVIINDNTLLANKLLKKLCLSCIKYTPVTAIDSPYGLILDASGCTHLWGGEENYLRSIIDKFKRCGFHVRAAMADSIGTARAVARYGKLKAIIPPGKQAEALMPLPPEALNLEFDTVERLHKLGLHTIGSFMSMPRQVLRRRFGKGLLSRLDQALGTEKEFIEPVIPLEPYGERLPCLEPIQTRTGIEIALEELLNNLCARLLKEGKGIRTASFSGYRIDGKREQITIYTNHASNNPKHLFQLFSIKIQTIEPAPGIELFTLEAPKVEVTSIIQESLWKGKSSFECREIAELLDNIESKFGSNTVHRYLPDEHHLPERSYRLATFLNETPATPWCTGKLRPLQLLQTPEPITVMAPIPDYPPMQFRYKGELYKVAKADACERIEPEWWLDGGLHRDYYTVEDQEGKRYWLFRAGHYTGSTNPSWFLHGFFA